MVYHPKFNDLDNVTGYWLNMIPYITFPKSTNEQISTMDDETNSKLERIYLLRQKDINLIEEKYYHVLKSLKCEDILDILQFRDIQEPELLERGEVRVNGILMMSSLNTITTDMVWEALGFEYPEEFPDILGSFVSHQRSIKKLKDVITEYKYFLLSTNFETAYFLKHSNRYCSVCPYTIDLACKKQIMHSDIESNFLNDLCNTSERWVLSFIKTEYSYNLLVIDKQSKIICAYGIERDHPCEDSIIYFIDSSLPLCFDYHVKMKDYLPYEIAEDIGRELFYYLGETVRFLISIPGFNSIDAYHISYQVTSPGTKEHLLDYINGTNNAELIYTEEDIPVYDETDYNKTMKFSTGNLISYILNREILTLRHLSHFTRTNYNMNYISPDGYSPLSAAIEMNLPFVIQWAVENGANLSELSLEDDVREHTFGYVPKTKLLRSLSNCEALTWRMIVTTLGSELAKYSNKIHNSIKITMGYVISFFNIGNVIMYGSILGGIVAMYTFGSKIPLEYITTALNELSQKIGPVDSMVKYIQNAIQTPGPVLLKYGRMYIR